MSNRRCRLYLRLRKAEKRTKPSAASGRNQI
jgi:hypothetical protein